MSSQLEENRKKRAELAMQEMFDSLEQLSSDIAYVDCSGFEYNNEGLVMSRPIFVHVDGNEDETVLATYTAEFNYASDQLMEARINTHKGTYYHSDLLAKAEVRSAPAM